MELVLLAGVALAALSVIVSTLRLGISPMPTARKVRRVMLSLVPHLFLLSRLAAPRLS
jgi:hypothetical protein